MKISLITVTYNSATTLSNTIESVISQTYPHIEYIIVDGASTDHTPQILSTYQQQITTVLSEPDLGIYDAMNKGVQMATGDVIGFLNADDMFNSVTAVEEAMRTFLANDQIDGVYADLYYVAKNNTDKIVRHWRSGRQRPFSRGWHPAHPTFYVRRAVYQRLGSFNLDLQFAADFELMLRFVEKGGISLAYLPKPLVKMRLGGVSNNSVWNILKGNFESYKSFRMNGIPVTLFYPFLRLVPKLKQFFI